MWKSAESCFGNAADLEVDFAGSAQYVDFRIVDCQNVDAGSLTS